MSMSPAEPDVIVTTKPKERERAKVRRQPPFNVILETDDHHSMQFVEDVLRKVLGCSAEKAYQYVITAHTTGRAVIWTGPKEVAELKVEQVRTFHEIRVYGPKLGPLGCTMEPAPGG